MRYLFLNLDSVGGVRPRHNRLAMQLTPSFPYPFHPFPLYPFTPLPLYPFLPDRGYSRMRSLPTRRVNFSRSRYSSSGMACLRVMSKSSLKSATPNLLPGANLPLICCLDGFQGRPVIDEIVGNLDQDLLLDHPEKDPTYFFRIAVNRTLHIGKRRRLIARLLEQGFDLFPHLVAFGRKLHFPAVQRNGVFLERRSCVFRPIASRQWRKTSSGRSSKSRLRSSSLEIPF